METSSQKETSPPTRLELALLLAASMIATSCAHLPAKEYFSADGKTTQHRYITSAVSGSIVTADGSIGVFASASVSMNRRGSMTLTFYRLTESREPLTVRKVRFNLNRETMTDGREIRFNDSGVSNSVQGRFDYSSYFKAIPIQVEFSSGEHVWSRELELRHSIGKSFIDAIKAYPKAPGSVTEFRAMQRPAALDKPRFPATERP
jgi:hypothetical protein